MGKQAKAAFQFEPTIVKGTLWCFLSSERALQFREKVLPAVMSWDVVFGENGKNNYLIVKENHIQESIQPFVS